MCPKLLGMFTIADMAAVIQASASAKLLGMLTIADMAAVIRSWLLGEREATRFNIAVPLRGVPGGQNRSA